MLGQNIALISATKIVLVTSLGNQLRRKLKSFKKIQPAHIKTFKSSQKYFRGSAKFLNQTLRQIDQGVHEL